MKKYFELVKKVKMFKPNPTLVLVSVDCDECAFNGQPGGMKGGGCVQSKLEHQPPKLRRCVSPHQKGLASSAKTFDQG